MNDHSTSTCYDSSTCMYYDYSTCMFYDYSTCTYYDHCTCLYYKHRTYMYDDHGTHLYYDHNTCMHVNSFCTTLVKMLFVSFPDGWMGWRADGRGSNNGKNLGRGKKRKISLQDDFILGDGRAKPMFCFPHQFSGVLRSCCLPPVLSKEASLAEPLVLNFSENSKTWKRKLFSKLKTQGDGNYDSTRKHYDHST